jgi:NAD+ synthase (glutamine-hydrolysing)
VGSTHFLTDSQGTIVEKSHQAHLAAASLNQTVGDWAGNESRIRQVIGQARESGAKLLLLPEMCIPGYSLGDRLLRVGTIERSWDLLIRLLDASKGIAVAVGLPVQFEGVLYNAMALIANGKVVGLAAKENLATGDVEYENRYFLSWPHGRLVDYRGPDGTVCPLGTQMFELPGLGTIAFEICEDAWKGLRPGSTYALAGAEILLNPSASWFSIGKHKTRRRLVAQVSQEDHCVYLYTSLLGCDATRLIFDGSLFLAVNGRIEAEGRRFLFTQDYELIHRVVDLREIRHVRMEEGSWRDQTSRAQWGAYGETPGIVRVPGDFSTCEVAPAPPPYWIPPEPSHPDPSLEYLENSVFHGKKIGERDLNHLELELALALALRDYTRKTGVKTCALALSGGRDSAMVALLVQRMHAYGAPGIDPLTLRDEIHDRFLCAYLATENSGSKTHDAAKAIAEEIGATFFDGKIQPALTAAHEVVESMTGEALSWSNPRLDIPLQNIQARVRGMLIWTLANLHNALLLVTSNKSEAAVGYTTMDGDSSGGLAPIADVPKSLIKLYLDWAASFHGMTSLEKIKAMEASAELRPPGSEQTDEADLMPFAVLDQLMYAFVQLALDPLEILRRYWPSMKCYYDNDLARFAADVRKFVRLFCIAQWKRERFAISFRVTAFDLDPKTGFRFPPVQAPFTEELAEMDRYVQGVLESEAATERESWS